MKQFPRYSCLAILLLVAACGKSPEETPAQSRAYYASHPDEAMQVANKCMAFSKNEFSLMSPTKQDAWNETQAGINCTNARGAAVDAALYAHQKELSDAAEKFHQQLVEKSHR